MEYMPPNMKLNPTAVFTPTKRVEHTLSATKLVQASGGSDQSSGGKSEENLSERESGDNEEENEIVAETASTLNRRHTEA